MQPPWTAPAAAASEGEATGCATGAWKSRRQVCHEHFEAQRLPNLWLGDGASFKIRETRLSFVAFVLQYLGTLASLQFYSTLAWRVLCGHIRH